MATKNVVGHLVYKITGDSKELDQGLKKSQDSTAKFTKFMKSALGIGGAVVAVKMLIGIGKDLIAAYGVQEQAENRLAAAIRARGGNVEELMAQYTDFASEVQRVTTVGDEQTLGLIQIGESLGIARGQMQDATRGAIGLSKAFGIDMNTAMRGIALAYEGQYTQLSRYIPALRTAGTEAERQAVLQEAMANGFEIAKAEAESGTGAMLQLQNAIGDLKEQGGAALTEFLTPSIKGLTAFVTRTTEAIAESRRLKKVAEELAEGKQIAAVDEIALLNAQIKTLESHRQMVQGYKESVASIDQQIAAIKREIAALAEVARWKAIGEDARRRSDAEAQAAAEVEAQRQRELADWLKIINEEYPKTPEAQREALEANIAMFENMLTQANVTKPKIQAILDMLYKQRDANVEITDTWKEQVAAMAAETDAAMVAYQLRLDAEQAYREEMAAIAARARAQELLDEEKLAADKEKLQQAAMDSFVQIWGELRSLQDQKTRYELAQLERRQAAELATFEGTEEEKKALIEQFEKEKAKLEYEAALKSWKLQLAGALAAVARSIVEAAKNFWPIPALPLMALAAAMGGIQITAVRAAKPVPEFAAGADFIVPPGYPNDSYPMRVESGEHVVVEPRGRVTMQAPLIIEIDGTPVYQGLLRATTDGIALVAERAVVRR